VQGLLRNWNGNSKWTGSTLCLTTKNRSAGTGGKQRNERRKERYRTDVQYRKHVRQQTREHLPPIAPSDGHTGAHDNCAANIALLDQIGEVRNVRYEEDVRNRC
jgi:hypothetical protein